MEIIKILISRSYALLILIIATSAIGAVLPDLDPNNNYKLTAQLDTALENYQATLNKVTQTEPSWNNTIQPLQEATNEVIRTWALITQLTIADDKTLAKITGFYRLAMNNLQLATAYTKISQSTEYANLSPLQQLHIQQMLLYFKLSGANLDKSKKDQHWQIVQRLAKLQHELTKNINQTASDSFYTITKESDLSGIPEHYKTKLLTAGKITMETDNVAAIMMYAKNRELRKAFYNGFNSSNKNNESLIIEILQLRQELANLLGYSNFSEYSIADKLAPNSTQILQFLSDFIQKHSALASKEIVVLQNYAFSKDNLNKIEPWDLVFYAQEYKDQQFGINAYELMHYFPLENVLSSLFSLTDLLYNLKVTKQHDAYIIQDEKSNILGYFYLDLFAREAKKSSNYVLNYTSRLLLSDGQLQLPISFINTNFMSRGDNLLTHYDVIILYSNFGRMLSNILSTNNYLNISGINGLERDSLQLAADFTKHWVWNYFKTTLPRDVFEKIQAENDFNSGLAALFQAQTAMLDFRLNLNSKTDLGKSPLEVANEIRQEFLVGPKLEAVFASGYKADYYVNLWAQHLADNCFNNFNSQQGINSKVGRKFFDTVLSKSGQASTFELTNDFLGRAGTNL